MIGGIRRLLLLSLSLALIGYSGPSMSHWPLDAYLERATVVATVRVVQGGLIAAAPHECSHSYKVQTVEAVRGHIPAAGLVTEAKLAIGAEYLIIAALDTDWAERQLGTGDATVGAMRHPRIGECARYSTSALMISISEVFLIVSTAGSSSQWMVARPGWFKAPGAVRRVIDFERVEVVGYRVDQPSLELRDYFVLDDVLKLLGDQD